MKSLFNASRLRVVLIASVAVLLATLELASVFPDVSTPLERLELGARDTMIRIGGVRQPSPDIIIVAIDDASFAGTGYQWPWPRTYLAQIVDAVNKGGAQVVALDIFLSQPDRDPAGDAALAKALSESPFAVLDLQILDTPVLNGSVVVAHTSEIRNPQSVYLNIQDGLGIASIFQDKDAITRRVQAFQYSASDQHTYYSWALEVARLYAGAPSPTMPTPSSVMIGNLRVPLDNKGNLLVNFAGPAGTYQTYSAYQVGLGDVLEMDPNAFKDKIVLIGATTVTLHDVYATPFSARQPTPGVEVVANAIDTIISSKFLRVTPPWFSILIIVLSALLAAVIVRIQHPIQTLGVMAACMVAYALIAYFAFKLGGLFIPIVGPQLMLFLGVVLPTLEQGVSQEREKRRVRNLFTRFISPEMVDQLIATQDITSLNKRADVSILFSDIRGFTTLSEKLPPEEVVALLNPYLEAMTRIIDNFGGTVDKYEGDAIIAFFGEPVVHEDHALRAVRTAVEMRKALVMLHQRWEKEGRPYHIEVGIGINSGEVFVGLLGSAQRINYTIIGDNANLASRLQDLTKTYQWPILISESTYQQVKDEFDVEQADAVIVKGRTGTINIYRLLGRKNAPKAERIQPWDAETVSMIQPAG
jgi:adenylate cyclase